MSKFDSEYYLRFRPYYPSETFHHLEKSLKDRGFEEPFQIADIGCGTGHSLLSLLHTGIHANLIGIDPDPKMLEQAKELTQRCESPIELQIGTGEQTELNSKSLDTVIIGSAFHWMDPEKTKDELARILKPKGLVRIMEYQFPKALGHPTLNEWIRRQFNLFWKAPNQKPRGSFTQIVSCFNSDQRFSKSGSASPQMIQSLTANDLLGLLWSQSRVLCYVSTLFEEDRVRHYNEVGNKLEKEFTSPRIDFDFKLQWIEFEKLSDGLL